MNKFKQMSIAIIPILFCLTITTTALSQSNNEAILKVKITNNLPVGWGYINKGAVTEVIEGQGFLFSKEVEFGIVAGHYCEDLKIDDVVIIHINNTKEKNPQTYLPARNCIISLKNEIWEITKIKKFD